MKSAYSCYEFTPLQFHKLPPDSCRYWWSIVILMMLHRSKELSSFCEFKLSICTKINVSVFNPKRLWIAPDVFQLWLYSQTGSKAKFHLASSMQIILFTATNSQCALQMLWFSIIAQEMKGILCPYFPFGYWITETTLGSQPETVDFDYRVLLWCVVGELLFLLFFLP